MPARAVLVVPVADATLVAGACNALRLAVHTVPAAEAGTAIVLPPGAHAEQATHSVSRLFGRADLLLLVRSHGHVTVHRWQAGVPQDEPPAGLALTALPDVVERLLLSDTPATQEPGAVSSEGIPRTAATRAMLAIHRAGADPASARRMRRVDLVGGALLLAAMLVLLAISVSAVAGGGAGLLSWVVVVAAAVGSAAAGRWLLIALRRPS